MRLRDMELLVRVAQTGSMTLAAQQLHLTPAAVSAAVLRIEDTLGLRLFARTTRSLHPTDEGVVVLEACEDVVARWRRGLDEARGPHVEPTGTVDLASPADTTYTTLDAVVTRLTARHPALRIVLHTSDAIQHLQRDAIDLAIRYGPLRDSSLTARKLVESPRVLVAAPAYLSRHGRPERLEALAAHRLLTLRLSNAPTTSWALVGEGRSVRLPVDSPLCGDGYHVRRWAVAGEGVAFKSLVDVIDDLEAGRLEHLLPAYSGGQIAVHAVMPSRRFRPARVRAVDAAIAEAFAERAARCEAWTARIS
jgi:DNA-binding transcriptional LysR family regulator